MSTVTDRRTRSIHSEAVGLESNPQHSAPDPSTETRNPNPLENPQLYAELISSSAVEQSTDRSSPPLSREFYDDGASLSKGLISDVVFLHVSDISINLWKEGFHVDLEALKDTAKPLQTPTDEYFMVRCFI